MVSNIWVAAADNQVEIVKAHLDSGSFSANSKDPNGYTPIHAASSYGHTQLLELLISNGGNINIQDNEGDTPLHHAEDIKTAQFLVEQLGADYKIKNNDGLTAADYIEEEDDFPQLAQYLRSLAHDQPGGSGDAALVQQNEFLQSLPAPGNVDGHQIRYTMENEAGGSGSAANDAGFDEERRKQIEAILKSENPEEGLRDLVTSAVREGFADYKQEQQQGLEQDAPSSKKRKE